MSIDSRANAGRRIEPPKDLVEAAAAIEVAKSVAFCALSFAMLEVLNSDQFAMHTLKEQMLAQFKRAEVNLPNEEKQRYQSYAEATVEELFGRLTVNKNPLNPKSS